MTAVFAELFARLSATKKRASLDAAITLVRGLLGSDEGQAVLPSLVTIASSTEQSIQVSFGEEPTAGPRTVVDLDELRSVRPVSPDTFLSLLFVKAFPDVVAPSRDLDIQFDYRSHVTEIARRCDDAVDTERVSDICRRLRTDNDVALLGESASGKTVSGAQTCMDLVGSNATVSWIDLATPRGDACTLLNMLCKTRIYPNAPHLIILDNVQANPGEVKRLSTLLPTLRTCTRCALRLLVIGWESACSFVEDLFPTCSVLPVSGDEILVPLADAILKRAVSDRELDQIRECTHGDLVVARLCIENIRDQGDLPTLDALANRALQARIGTLSLDRQATELLYRVASLGRCEIAMARAFARHVAPEAIDILLNAGVLRATGDFVTLGHRSTAGLVLRYLTLHNAAHIAELGSPTQIAVDYLRASDAKQVAATLERLDMASLAQLEVDQHGATYLARAWRSLQALIRLLRSQAKADPSWGDSTSRAVFASKAFAELEDPAWETGAAYLRERWRVEAGNTLPIPVNAPPSERADFDQIAARMEEEDKTNRSIVPGQAGREIDLERMHRTWVLGLLLGFEGRARVRAPERLAQLKDMAYRVQEASGAFYPARVPWVTARVAIGLALAGESLGNSDALRRACEWLRSSPPDGPFKLGAWESGTGAWNTTVGTTAMCVYALVRAGVPASDYVVKQAAAYLLRSRAEWLRPGQEIDGAFAIETILLIRRGRWREVDKELAYLLNWAGDREAWLKATSATASNEESCKFPQVASSLVGIVWETVRAELPLLIEGATSAATDVAQDMRASELRRLDALVHDGIRRMKARLDDEIQARERAIAKVGNITSSKQELERFIERRALIVRIEGEYQDPSRVSYGGRQSQLTAIASQLNAYGQEWFGNAWIPIKGEAAAGEIT